MINRFEGVAIEWFARQTNVWSKKHCQDVERRLRVNTFPLIGEKDIADIDAPELLLMVREIESRGAYELAHRVLNVCGQVFRYGIATGRCKYNPAPDLKGALIPVKPKNQPSIKPAQLPKLMADIADYETIGDRKTQLAMLMLAHTFVRTSELIFATWNEFDLDKAIWSIPKERMKMEREHIVPLTKSVLVFLVELKRLGVSEGADFVFVGRNREKPMSTNTVLFGLYRLGYKGKMCGHGFRSVASTVLYESGLFISDVIEKQLAHEERNEVKGAYNRAEYLPARVAMMEWWSCYLDSTC